MPKKEEIMKKSKVFLGALFLATAIKANCYLIETGFSKIYVSEVKEEEVYNIKYYVYTDASNNSFSRIEKAKVKSLTSLPESDCEKLSKNSQQSTIPKSEMEAKISITGSINPTQPPFVNKTKHPDELVISSVDSSSTVQI
jgi:hypothetical protein